MHTFAAVSFRDERKKRKMYKTRERRERFPDAHTAQNNKNKNNRRRRALKKTTHQTPHAADDKPVGNPGGDRTDADESRERRSRIRSSHLMVYSFYSSEDFVFTTVRPFPIEMSPLFKTIYDDDAKRDDDALCWCAKRSFSVSRSLCLLEEDFESIDDSFLSSSSSVYQREF